MPLALSAALIVSLFTLLLLHLLLYYPPLIPRNQALFAASYNSSLSHIITTNPNILTPCKFSSIVINPTAVVVVFNISGVYPLWYRTQSNIDKVFSTRKVSSSIVIRCLRILKCGESHVLFEGRPLYDILCARAWLHEDRRRFGSGCP